MRVRWGVQGGCDQCGLVGNPVPALNRCVDLTFAEFLPAFRAWQFRNSFERLTLS